MPTLTLLDLAKRTGSDATIGLIEDVLTYAPEFRTLPAIPKPGTSYKATLRTGLPTSGFRAVGAGATLSSSTYIQKLVEMFFFDVQLQVDEAIVKGDSREIGDVLTDEASGAVESTFITIGSQVYYGTNADKKGFQGFAQNVDSSMIIDAGGTGNSTTSAWFVFESEKGVHIPVGNQGAIDMMPEWLRQQVTDPNDSTKKLMAYVNNLSCYIGLAIGSKYSIGRIKNITDAKPLTDKLTAQLLSKFPVGRQPTRCFVNRDARLYLQQSRTSINYQTSDKGGRGAFAPLPEETVGIPIQVTDSITSTETAS